MGGYKPLKIAGFETGLIQDREDFLLVSDGFPVLENAYVWREKVLKKLGNEGYARLRRVLTSQTITATAASATYTEADAIATLGLRATEPNASIQCSGLILTIDPGGGSETILQDTASDGTLATTATNALNATGGTINYSTGAITVTFAAPIAGGLTVQIDFSYYPSLPVMGIRSRELNGIGQEEAIAFDTKYAYTRTSNNWQEFIAGTTWQGADNEFFWSTNYWVDASNNKLFWVTNFNNSVGTNDPIRYTDGTTWTAFTPAITATTSLFQAAIILPFRGRLFMLNTWEGATAATAVQQRQRIRASQIGSPLDADAYRQDIRGKGLFLDIPTSQNIIGAGYVRDNLVIFCERSTWQLRYTGRDISPVQIERVNDELGSESRFSAIQFDKALVGVGDKRITSCDSFSAEPIDIKIPDLTIKIENENNGHARVHGVRDIVRRLTYWTYPSSETELHGDTAVKFPNRVLVYNYENESWGIFKDYITALGTTWRESDPTWADQGDITWAEHNGSWIGEQANQPILIGGNQQGYVFKIYRLTGNDPSLQIVDITGNTTTATRLKIPDHNLSSGDIIQVVNIPAGTAFATALNDKNFYVSYVDDDNVDLFTYNSTLDEWSDPQLDAAATYIGCGEVRIRDNFIIRSKKFHHMDEGQKIQIGYIDALFDSSASGQVALNMYVDYQDQVMNNGVDPVFNVDLQTNSTDLDIQGQSKYWRRVFCPLRGNFVQAEFTHSNSQMNTDSAQSAVVLNAMVIHERMAGRLTI